MTMTRGISTSQHDKYISYIYVVENKARMEIYTIDDS